jgi:hypothetical protein
MEAGRPARARDADSRASQLPGPGRRPPLVSSSADNDSGPDPGQSALLTLSMPVMTAGKVGERRSLAGA